MPTVDELVELAQALSMEERELLVHRLTVSLGASEPEMPTVAWTREIEDRVQRLEDDGLPTRPADEVFARLFQTLGAVGRER